MRLIFGHDRAVAEWAVSKYQSLSPWWHAIGIIGHDGKLIGAATLHDFNGSNVELCYWGPWSLKLPIARGIARFCFDHLNVNRVSCRTPRWNKPVIKGLPKIGFRVEGVARCHYGPKKRDDAILFGLIRKDARRLLGGR